LTCKRQKITFQIDISNIRCKLTDILNHTGDTTIEFTGTRLDALTQGSADPDQYALFPVNPNQDRDRQTREVDEFFEKSAPVLNEERQMWTRAVNTRDIMMNNVIAEELANQGTPNKRVLSREFKEKWVSVVNNIDVISEEQAEADYLDVLKGDTDEALQKGVLAYIINQTLDKTRFTENPHYKTIIKDAKQHAQLRSLYSIIVMPRIVGKLLMVGIADIVTPPGQAVGFMERVINLAETANDVHQNPNRGLLECLAAYKDNTPGNQDIFLAGLRAQAADRQAFLQRLFTEGTAGHQRNHLTETFLQATRLWLGNRPDWISYAAEYGAENAEQWPKVLEQEFQQAVAPEKHTLWLRYNRAITPYRSPERAPGGMQISEPYFRKRLQNPPKKGAVIGPLPWEAVDGLRLAPNPFLP